MLLTLMIRRFWCEFSWNKAYERELSNFESNQTDIGEIWFGEDVQERVCDWIALGCQDDDGEDDAEGVGSEAFPGVRHMHSKVLDIGCGNAAALIYLAQEYGFEQLFGVDYSEAGIALAKKVALKDETTEHIQLFVLDLTDLNSFFMRHKDGAPLKYDVLFDKGTFDAICLNEDKHMRNRYVAAIMSMMTPSSYFIITSCNWTQQEIVQIFESMSCFDARAAENLELAQLQPAPMSLKLFKVLKHPEFSFGGRSGSTVATVAFKIGS